MILFLTIIWNIQIIFIIPAKHASYPYIIIIKEQPVTLKAENMPSYTSHVVLGILQCVDPSVYIRRDPAHLKRVKLYIKFAIFLNEYLDWSLWRLPVQFSCNSVMNILLMVVEEANYISFIATCPFLWLFRIKKVFMYSFE